MTTLLKKDYQYSSVLWEEVMQRVQEIIRDEYNISPYVSPTLNPKTPSPFRIWSSAQGTDALYVGAWHKEYTISVNHYLKTEDSERFYKKVYEESERLYQLFFNNQGTQSTQTLGFFGGRPEGIQISQEGDYFRIEVLFTCEVLRADDVVYVQTLPSEIRATKRALELPFNFWSLDFDGTDDYINLGSFTTSGDLTVSMWFQVRSYTDDGSQQRTLLVLASSNATDAIMINSYNGRNDIDVAVKYNAGDDSRYNFRTTTTFDLNKWYNIVVTKTGGEIGNVYINGVQETRATPTLFVSIPTGVNQIGSGTSQEYVWNGLISETAIFNSVLSSSEISTIYNDGQPILLTENQGSYKSSSNLVAYYRMGSGSGDNRITTGYIADQVDSSIGSEMVDNGGFDGISNGTNVTSLDDWTAYGTAISTTIEDGKLRIVSDALGEGAKLTITGATTDAFYRFTCDVTGDLGLYSVYARTVEGDTYISTTNGSVDIVLVGYASKVTIIFRAGTGTSGGTSYYDNISVKPLNGNAGSMVNFDSLDFRTNVPLLYDKALFSNSLLFDGTDDEINTRLEGLSAGSSFTFSAWINGNTFASTDKTIISNGQLTNHRLFSIEGGKLFLQIFNGGYTGDSVTKAMASTTFSTGVWYNAVATYDGTNIKLYINGIEETTTEDGEGSTGNVSNTTTIGYLLRGTKESFFSGNIADVSIYNTVLNQDNVTAIYNSGKPIDLTCDAGNYNNANNLVGYWKMGDGYLDELPSADNDGVIFDQVTPIIDDDMIGNGDFSNSTNWSLGANWEISDEKLKGTSNNSNANRTGLTITQGKLYKLSFEITSHTSGSVRLGIGGTVGTYRNAVGSYEEYIFAGSSANLTFNGKTGDAFTGEIDNVKAQLVNGNPGKTNAMNASAQSISVPK